ncbi:ATP-binding cassette sub-family F member 3 [Lepeophtheirus salmonis]|uniref:ATP-binding cassette sub-family F member 3 n=1 Tax=Lepeophtheirus salmonis TaxID=72036 RepID=UPI001AE88ECA|nr:ATP-binding cassette sub-family F member 3-like [Lepeophtheirus salmonis]XP_040578255.1 ATP-binding cassette sub-family F member 3-like [Lepeophtheirus salmonis]
MSEGEGGCGFLSAELRRLCLRRGACSLDSQSEVLEYCEGVLWRCGEDLESGSEVYDALGELLEELLPGEAEAEIRALCDELYGLLGLRTGKSRPGEGLLCLESGGSGVSELCSPICLGESLEGAEVLDSLQGGRGSIWMEEKRGLGRVDKEKLEKAEKALLKKQGKDSSLKSHSSSQLILQATASQVLPKTRTDFNLSKDIRLEGVDVAFGDKILIQNTNLSLIHGRRYGLVGRNGLGKSTFLRMLSSSQLRIPTHISILHVEQEVVGDDTSALQSVLESDTKRQSLIQEAQHLSKEALNSYRLSEIYTEMEAIEADKAPSRASIILSGLGFDVIMQNKSTKKFSGGWRMRIALARALFCKPDLLLLDEPTNMLDMEAIVWLEKYLQTWQSTLLVVSHNRNFLDNVTTDIIHLQSKRLDTYKGNYTVFINQMTEKLKAQRREYEAQQDYRKHVQEFIDKFRFNAKRASLVQSRIKQLEKLPFLMPVVKEAEIIIRFPDVQKLSPPILCLNDVKFSYDGKNDIFDHVDISATMESRICIVGKNGSGKSTLLKLIMEEISVTDGRRIVHRNLKFGYFSQHHVDQLNMNLCPLQIMEKKFRGKKMEECRQMLGHFGISGDLALQKTSSLSGGQKSRVAFAVLCGEEPNFLILDEPTNHLDLETIDALGHGLMKYNGGLILVCHDERLIRMVCQELWVCSKGKISRLEGGFDEYRRILELELEI